MLDVAVCNLAGMELGMATAALLRARERARQEQQRHVGSGGGGGGGDAWGGVSTRKGALAKARRVAAQFSPRSWEERDWNPRGSPRRAGWALFLVAAFLLFDVSKQKKSFLFPFFFFSRLEKKKEKKNFLRSLALSLNHRQKKKKKNSSTPSS